jgi:hypothetical protein
VVNIICFVVGIQQYVARLQETLSGFNSHIEMQISKKHSDNFRKSDRDQMMSVFDTYLMDRR